MTNPSTTFVGALAAAGFVEPARAARAAERDPAVSRCREAALELLDASEGEMARAYALHVDSVVFDAYGFAPRAAIDGEMLARLIEENASAKELERHRERMIMTRMADDPVERDWFFRTWAAAGVTCQFQNAGEEGQDPLAMLRRLSHFTYATDQLKPRLAKVTRAEEIEAAAGEGRHCLCFTANGVPIEQRWETIPDELQFVAIFRDLGIRMMHLTYNRRNMLGDGCGEATDAGLSDFGRAAVTELNRQGVIPDVAHCGWRTSREVAEVSSKPVVASHTSAAALHVHPRAKPDEVMRAVAATGGVIGICAVPPFLGLSGDLHALLDHVDYVAGRFGVDHVAIGTDTAVMSPNMDRERARMPPAPAARPPFPSLWPEGAFAGYDRDHPSLNWINWPLFTLGLVRRGYDDQAVRKIIGGNMLRVLRDTAG